MGSAKQFELVYFNSKGFAEPIRILFHIAGIKFTDTRVERNKKELKQALADSPGGVLPVIRVNGYVACQSKAITRYVAALSGYIGYTPEENLKVDMFVDEMYDLIAAYDEVVHERDTKLKEEKKLKAFSKDGYFRKFLFRLESMIEVGPFILGDKMTWGDVTVMSFLELKQTPQFGRADLLDDFPKLKTQYKSVQANPNVKIWLEIRPQTLK